MKNENKFNEGVKASISYKTCDGRNVYTEFTFDTIEIVEAAKKCGQFQMAFDSLKKREVLHFYSHVNFPLIYPNNNSIWGGKQCTSFLPYIGLKPYTRLIDPENHFDMRKCAFRNGFHPSRQANLADYIPKFVKKEFTYPFVDTSTEQFDREAEINIIASSSMANIDAIKVVEAIDTLMLATNWDVVTAINFIKSRIIIKK
jgi:hypothetical protein